MAIYSETNSFGKRLCKILNLDPSKTRAITIKVMPDAIVMVDVNLYLEEEESKELLEMIKNYKLVEQFDNGKDKKNENT